MTTPWPCGPERLPNVGNKFTFNTVGVTLLANNIVTYGGRDIQITDNVVADSVTNGGGIHIANRYPGVNSGQGTAVAGTHTVARNTLIRAGNNDFNWHFGVGAIWFSGLNEPVNATINVTDTDILDSSYAAIHMIEGTTRTVNFNNVNIDGTGTYMIQAQAGANVTFTNVRAAHLGAGPADPQLRRQRPSRSPGRREHRLEPQRPGLHRHLAAAELHLPGRRQPRAEPHGDRRPRPRRSRPRTGNLARGKGTTESGHAQSYGSGNIVDGNASTYWESTNNAFPQWPPWTSAPPPASARSP